MARAVPAASTDERPAWKAAPRVDPVWAWGCGALAAGAMALVPTVGKVPDSFLVAALVIVPLGTAILAWVRPVAWTQAALFTLVVQNVALLWALLPVMAWAGRGATSRLEGAAVALAGGLGSAALSAVIAAARGRRKATPRSLPERTSRSAAPGPGETAGPGGARCGACQAPREPGDRFCGSCGASLTGTRPVIPDA